MTLEVKWVAKWGGAEPALELAAPLARPLPLRAWGALPTWGSTIYYLMIYYRSLRGAAVERGRARRAGHRCLRAAGDILSGGDDIKTRLLSY